jgi:hypothetical protein
MNSSSFIKKLSLKVKISTFAVAVLVFLPGLTFADSVTNLTGFFNLGLNFINSAMPFIISLATLYFIWGVFSFVISNNGEKREEAKGYLMWGLVALFVMISVWGLVNIAISSFNLDNTAPPSPVVTFSS